jgi:hypothetical protein
MDMRAIVADRMADLQRADDAALQRLPPQQREVLPEDDRTVVTKYHEVTDAGEHRVVVQVLRNRWLGLSTAIEVDGLVLDTHGVRRPLT